MGPNNKPAITIDALLEEHDDSEHNFCEDIQLKVTVQNALTKEALADTSATVIHYCEETGEEEVVAEGALTDLQGELFVDIAHGGHYEVKVSSAGYVTTAKSVTVDCPPAYCSICAPSIVVPLSPALGEDQLRLTLGGGNNLDNLDIYAVYKDSSSSCVTTPTGDSDVNCPGVDSVTGTDGQGVETITFNQPTGETPSVYTVFVEWTQPAQHDDISIIATDAHVSVTDGRITEDISLSVVGYGGERYWVAGCLLLAGNTDPAYQFLPLNVYFTERPDVEVPDLCLETFGLKPKGKQWDGQCVKDGKSRVLPVLFGYTEVNSPEYCVEKCRAHEYNYAGVEWAGECFCGHTPPTADELADEEDCHMACPGDLTETCGGDWRINVYETGFDSGLAMTTERNCECEYGSGGCRVTSAPPAGYSCHCRYQGRLTCDAVLRHCESESTCPADCTSKACCQLGGGDCGAYWFWEK